MNKINPPLPESPGCCKICRAADLQDREWFLDLEYIEDYWGRVYYCNLCFADMALAANYIPIEKLRQVQSDHDELMTAFWNAHWETNGFLDLLRDAGLDLRAFFVWLRSVVDGEAAIELPSRTNSLVNGANGTSESTDESRSDDSSSASFNL